MDHNETPDPDPTTPRDTPADSVQLAVLVPLKLLCPDCAARIQQALAVQQDMPTTRLLAIQQPMPTTPFTDVDRGRGRWAPQILARLDDHAWHSAQDLCAAVGATTTDQLRRSLERLVSRGLVEAEKCDGYTGKRGTWRYRLATAPQEPAHGKGGPFATQRKGDPSAENRGGHAPGLDAIWSRRVAQRPDPYPK